MKNEFTKEDKDKDGKLNMVEFKTALKREGLQEVEIQGII
jgi:Ca2+-binding EF-hand superfamily protein